MNTSGSLRLSASSIQPVSANAQELSANLRFAVPCSIGYNTNSVSACLLPDTGCTAYAFMDKTFAHTHGLKTIPLKTPRVLTVFDGEETSDGEITAVASAPLRVGDHQEREVLFFLTKLSEVPIVLGMPWLAAHHVIVKAHLPALVFDPEHCASHIPHGGLTVVPGLSDAELSRIPSTGLSIKSVSAREFCKTAKLHQHHVYAARLEDINKALEEKPVPNLEKLLPIRYHK